MGRAAFLILLVGLSGGLTACLFDNGVKTGCVKAQYKGPEYASFYHYNRCGETIRTRVCKKELASELWNLLVRGDQTGGKWSCVNKVVADGGLIDIQIAAVENSSPARKAMAASSYFLFACAYDHRLKIVSLEAGTFKCEKA